LFSKTKMIPFGIYNLERNHIFSMGK